MLFFFYFNRNQKENDRYLHKNYVFIVAKCLTMYIFFAFAFKVCKKCQNDHQQFVCQKVNMGIKNIELYADLKFVCRLSKMFLRKISAKNHNKMCNNEICVVSGCIFFRGIFLSRHQRIWNQHKILRFLVPILTWNVFGVNHYNTFGKLGTQMRKNCTFLYIFLKVKNYFSNIYHSLFDSQLVWNIEAH
jgi:hypothetical protein